MTDNTAKKLRLDAIIEQIEDSRNDETVFPELYRLLLNEYQLEGGNKKESPYQSYHWNLKKTIEKEADIYLKNKNTRNYETFIDVFTVTINTGLSEI